MRRSGRREAPRWAREKRAVWAHVVVAVAVAGLLYSLIRIQVVRAEGFATVARQNMLWPVTVRAPGGTIYDRNGRVIAENRVAYSIQLMPAPLDSLRRQVGQLWPVLELTPGDTAWAYRRYRASPNRPMVLLEQELQQPEFANYRQGRWIGKAGLERQYERVLGGEPGIRYLQVDARGGIKRWLPESMGVTAVPGQDIHLNIDMDLVQGAVTMTPLKLAQITSGFARPDGRQVVPDLPVYGYAENGPQ